MAIQKIDLFGDGYCPESILKGKRVLMRLNRWDFFESEETGLQICVLSGVQAIILNFRGEGNFRGTSEYGDEIVYGEILSPQNSDRFPFNDPPSVFSSNDEIELYINSIRKSDDEWFGAYNKCYSSKVQY